MAATDSTGRIRRNSSPLSFRGTPIKSSKELRKKIGSLVRKHRLAAGLTQDQAGSPRVTRAMISAIENGKILPGLQTLRQLAVNLKKSIRDFLPEDLHY